MHFLQATDCKSTTAHLFFECKNAAINDKSWYCCYIEENPRPIPLHSDNT